MKTGRTIRLITFFLFALVLSSASAAENTDWLTVAERIPRTNLREEYHPVCRRTCEYIGFSFGGPLDELLEIRATGANSVGMGAMWNPIRTQEAPFGVDVRSYAGYGSLEQSFRAEKSFDGFAPCLPTGHSTDGGCRWEIYSGDRRLEDGKPVATGSWRNVVDNSWPEAPFPSQKPGMYTFRISDATGTWIGWWGRYGNPYSEGHACLGSSVKHDVDLEFRLHTADGWETLVSGEKGHVAFPLGPSRLKVVRDTGLFTNFSLGNWNNPGFPYYPDWFWEKFPEAGAVDQNGNTITGGMFGKSVPAPGIEHPAIVNGTTRFIETVVGELLHETPLIYWVMGGEAMYATYGYHGRWTDYSPNAIRHFREWLAHRRYPSIAELNTAWDTEFSGFDEVTPPREPAVNRSWLDWLDFRFESMGERFGWHYRAIRSVDPDRLILTCNHGSLYHALTYAEMGARPEIYASVSDGFETGQIMTDTDPDLYNIMYTESLCGLGKPYAPVRLAYKKSDPNARGGGTSYTPEAARRYVYESLGAGAWHLGLIQWSGSLPDGEWGVRGTPAEKEIAKLFSEIRSLWPLLDDTHALRPNVGVFLSHPTWALRGFQTEWQDFHVSAVRNQIPKNYVYETQFLSGDTAGLRYLISMNNSILSSGVADALLEFVERGGCLVVAGSFGDAPEKLNPPLPEPFLSRKSAEIGDGRILFLKQDDPKAVIAALSQVGAATEFQSVHVEAAGTVSRPAETLIAVHHTDWPQDLTSGRSLGQTVLVQKQGLRRVALRMPTYHNVPPAGFTFQVREGGPGGNVIATREVPQGIADNAWVEMEVTAPVPPGTTVYITATPDTSLPKNHLGWWSTRKDVYPPGSAYVDDRPVEGDRHVKLLFEEPVPVREAIESFVLTDGLDFGVVLINTGRKSIDAFVDLARLPFPEDASRYSVSAPLDPKRWTSPGLSAGVSIAGNGTLFLWAERETSPEEAAQALVEAQRCVAAWKQHNAVSPFVQYALRRAESYADEGRFSKSLAMALKVCASLGLAVEPRPSDGETDRVKLMAHVFDRHGDPLRADRVGAEFVPSPMFFHKLQANGRGVYRLALPANDIPPIYDYERGRYEAYHGPVQVRISARHLELSASRTVVIPATAQAAIRP